MGVAAQQERKSRSVGDRDLLPPSPSASACILTPDSWILLESNSTALGWIALARQGEVLVGLVFGHSSADKAEAALRRMLRSGRALRFVSAHSDLADELRRFAEGEPIDFAHVVIDDAHLAPFAKRVVAACRRIPWGQTRSYGQLAAECGSPAAARAVGQAMAKNRFPLVVPCHRVLAAGGRLGGYSAPQGLRMKRRLLALEGAEAFSKAKLCRA